MTEQSRTPPDEPKIPTTSEPDDVEGHALLDADLHRPIVSTRSRELADGPQGCRQPGSRPTDKTRSGR